MPVSSYIKLFFSFISSTYRGDKPMGNTHLMRMMHRGLFVILKDSRGHKEWLLVILCALLLPLYTLAQEEVTIWGNAAVQGIEDSEEQPAGDVFITIFTDEGQFLEYTTSISGSFYFKLPVGTDYFMEFFKEGYTVKRFLFDLNGIEPGDIKRSKADFDMTVTLVEEKFLTPSLKKEGAVTMIRWDSKEKDFVFSREKNYDYWDEFEALQFSYELAKNDLRSASVSDMILGFDNAISRPNDIGETEVIGVVGDYPLFVQMQLMKDEIPNGDRYEIRFIETFDDYKNEEEYDDVNTVYINSSSGVQSKDLIQGLDDDVLLITSGYGYHETMINFNTSMTDTRFEINDIELTKRGFEVSDAMKAQAELTKDKDEWAQVMNSAQTTLKDEITRAKDLEGQNKTLELEVADLEASKAALDSTLKQRNAEISALEEDIQKTSSRLKNLDRLVAMRNKELMDAQATFAAKQSALEEAELKMQQKEQRLEEYNRALEMTTKEIMKSEEQLMGTVQLLEDQRKLSYAAIVIAAFIGLLLIVAFRNYRKQRRYAIENKRQSEKLESQRMLLEEKNTELNDSINYAKRIQQAMLPGISSMKSFVKDSFIIYEPKDIVAGDFFWIQSYQDMVYFAVADCTGHGVPGAMMSVVCHNALNRALRELGGVTPATLLDRTRDFVIEQIAKTSDNVKDGMDIALCCWNPLTRKLQFSGAQNPLWIVTKNDLDGAEKVAVKAELEEVNVYEIKGDKQPIGLFDNAHPFENHEIELKKGDTIYLFSDGYADQFGGKRGKKMKYSLFRELVVMATPHDCEKQKEFLSEYFLNWRGELEQIDDVCVMGVQL